MDVWCAEQGLTRGEVLPVGDMWRLARSWYMDRLSPDWRPRSSADTVRRFNEAGLTGSFWALD